MAAGDRVLLTTSAAGRPLYAAAVRVLEEAGLDVVDTGTEAPEPPVLARIVTSADAVLSSLAPLSAEVIKAGKRLKVIAKVGAGVDNIDVDAATRHGIPVCNTPGANAESVADHALALMLALARNLLQLDATTRAGAGWDPWPPLLGEELAGKVLGVVGFGRAGQAVARRAQAFGMTCRAYDPFPDAVPTEARHGIQLTTLDELLVTADYVSLHVPLTDATRGLIGRRELVLMKSTAFLVNTARGPVVDHAALAEALTSGAIRGAGIDVFPDEPARTGPLFGMPKAILTPHVAGMTVEATTRARIQAAESIVAALNGRTPPRVVNAEAIAGGTAQLDTRDGRNKMTAIRIPISTSDTEQEV